MSAPPMKRVRLNAEAYQQFRQHHWGGSDLREGEALGIDRSNIRVIRNNLDRPVGQKFLARLIAYAESTGMDRGTAFTTLFELVDEPIAKAA